MFYSRQNPKNEKIILAVLLLIAWIAVIIYVLSLPNPEPGPILRFALCGAVVTGIVWRGQVSQIDARAARLDSPDNES